jgi:hypothetical protein
MKANYRTKIVEYFYMINNITEPLAIMSHGGCNNFILRCFFSSVSHIR